jgi:hypothetical protein
MTALGRALKGPGDLGQQVSVTARELAQRGHRSASSSLLSSRHLA